MIKSSTVTVTDTATALHTASSHSGLDATVLIYNSGADTMYVGSPTVTTANGIPVSPTGTLSVDIQLGEIIYAICAAAATTTARILQNKV